MNKKLIACLLFLSFFTKMAFCASLEDVEMEENGQGQLTGRLQSLKRRRSEELGGEFEDKRRCLSSPEQREKDARFWQAITDEDFRVEGILAAKANPNTRDKEGVTPLYYLASDPYGSSVCNSLVYDKQYHGKCLDFGSAVIEILLQNNADANLRGEGGKNGYTPLHATAIDFYVKRLGKSILYDEKFNFKYLKANFERAEKLLKYGANSNLKAGKDDQSILHCALVDHCGQELSNTAGFNPAFHQGYLDRRKEIVRILLSANADTNIQNAYNRTSLHLAVAVGHYPTVDLLLEHDADTGVRDLNSWMPIHITAKRAFPQGFFSVGLSLLQYDADLNAQTMAGKTVLSLDTNEYYAPIVRMINKRKIARKKLFLAILYPNIPLISKLIAAKVDVNQTEEKGETPLMYAARGTKSNKGPKFQKDEVEIVELLLDKKADPMVKTGDGTTALSLANSEGRIAIGHSIGVGNKEIAHRELLGLFKQFLDEEEDFEQNLIKLILEFASTYEPNQVNL